MKEEQEIRKIAVKEIASYYLDLRMRQNLKNNILERYKGALSAQPIGSGSDNRTGDPERRFLEIEELEKYSLLAGRIKRVTNVFTILFSKLEKWNFEELLNLMDSIIDHCHNRVVNNFEYLTRKYKLNISYHTFYRLKAIIIEEYIKLYNKDKEKVAS
jgi:hypothetical protein